MNRQEAIALFRQDRANLERLGVSFALGAPRPSSYLPSDPTALDEIVMAMDSALGFDAQPGLVTDPNAGIPSVFTTYVDPQVYEVLFAKNNATKIMSEERRGSWVQDTILFPIVEHAGEVTSYGDWNEDGTATANANWPERQNYIFQTMKQYGEREVERVGLGKINWISELDKSAATQLNKFMNLAYFYGIGQLANYGLLNDPALAAFITPSPKAYGNNLWVTGNFVTATANEIYTDIQALYFQLVAQTNGLVNNQTPVILGLSPGSRLALTAVNSFNVNVNTLLKENFPNIEIVDAVQYGGVSATNPQGYSTGGNVVQMIAKSVENQQSGFCAFSEKLRSHKIIQSVSGWKQKVSSGTWGTIVRQPANYAQMVGV